MKARKLLSVLSAFLMVVSMGIFSGTALAQASFGGTSYPTLQDAVDAMNAAGGNGTITLSAGTFNISKAILLDGNITIQGTTNASGAPASIITWDDSQPFELATFQGSAKYLFTVSNLANQDIEVNFTNVKIIAGSPTNNCTNSGAPVSPCNLGAFNYVVQDTTGNVKGTITNSVAEGGTVGLVIHNSSGAGAPDDACTVTLDGFVVSGNSWGGVNIDEGGMLILSGNGIMAPTGTTPETNLVYTDPGHMATVMFQDGSTQNVTGNNVLYILAFNPNGGNFGGSTVPKQLDEPSTADIITPATAPAWSGHVFTGWYTDPAATTLRDLTIPAASNETLYAGWALAARGTTAGVPATGNAVLVALGMLLAGLGVATLRRKYYR